MKRFLVPLIAGLGALACIDDFPLDTPPPLDDTALFFAEDTMMVGESDIASLDIPVSATEFLTGVDYRWESFDTTTLMVEKVTLIDGNPPATVAESLSIGRLARVTAVGAGFGALFVYLDSLRSENAPPIAIVNFTIQERWESVVVGRDQVCGVTKNGADVFAPKTIRRGSVAMCWGNGPWGQMGAGATTSSTVPVPVVGDLRFRSLSTGLIHTCGLDENALVYCWGSNLRGELGISEVLYDSHVPRPLIIGSPFTSIDGGDEFSCGVVELGFWATETHCWGRNDRGQLGSGDSTDGYQPEPIVPETSGQTQVAVGLAHACSLDLAGQTVLCWGDNANGQIGQPAGGFSDSARAITMPAGVEFGQITAGASYTCGLATAGTGGQVHCWGQNDVGQLGDGTGTDSFTATTVQGPASFTNATKTQISSYAEQTCALTDVGEVWCWGEVGTTVFGNVATLVAGGVTFESVSAGADKACGVRADHVLDTGDGTSPAVLISTGGAIMCWDQTTGFLPQRVPEPATGLVRLR